MKSQAIVVGSLGAVAQQNNMSIAESFLNVDALVVVDCSGSMDITDAPGGKSRYNTAVRELTHLQATLPGKIGVIAFSSTVMFCPSGTPQALGGGTDLAAALKFVHVADDLRIHLIVISDGEPDDRGEAMREARRFKSKIDVIFVGPEGGSGAKFLAELAAATGGQTVTADRVANLSATVQQLLGPRA